MLTKLDLSQIQKIVQDEIYPVKKDVKTIKLDLRKVKKTIDVMARVFDQEDVRLRKRVGSIEKHLGIPN